MSWIVRIFMLAAYVEQHPRHGAVHYTAHSYYLLAADRAEPMIAAGAAVLDSIPPQRGLTPEEAAELEAYLRGLFPQPPEEGGGDGEGEGDPGEGGEAPPDDEEPPPDDGALAEG